MKKLLLLLIFIGIPFMGYSQWEAYETTIASLNNETLVFECPLHVIISPYDIIMMSPKYTIRHGYTTSEWITLENTPELGKVKVYYLEDIEYIDLLSKNKYKNSSYVPSITEDLNIFVKFRIHDVIFLRYQGEDFQLTYEIR